MQAQPDKWEKEIAAFEAADRRRFPKPSGIVFVGSSTIKLWKSLERDFPGYGTLNRGFGGSNLPDSTHFAPRILLPYQPRQVVLFAGTNDINAKRTPRQVAQDFSDFVVTVRQLLPRTRISYIELTSSPSRWAQRDAVVEANAIIQRLCQRNGVDFIPVREKLFSPSREPRPELFITDKLHLNADGYKILADTVRPFLTH
ncbi:GDSL-type esterase/lipase family protein [Armatimonas sp.]|uniref:GDSL-type esterase/lipase family protein n=1 Tax=Armatimonas sp. TaxID=1872638 RepID=UPI00286A2D6D|nr:GDSL-type esterase/lipase family protein [Armatimonas sp.]